MGKAIFEIKYNEIIHEKPRLETALEIIDKLKKTNLKLTTLSIIEFLVIVYMVAVLVF